MSCNRESISDNCKITLPAPCISESFIKKKKNLDFYSTLLCGASKGTIEKFENKDFRKFLLIQFSEMHGEGRIKTPAEIA